MRQEGTTSPILIIGGTGYIGSALLSFLKQRKKNVVVDTIDIEWFGNPLNSDNKKEDFSSLSKEELSRYSSIVLLAGHSSVPMCQGNMLSAFNNNVSNFVRLLSLLSPTQRLIYASSSSVYNGATNNSEDAILNPALNWYDLTKRHIDEYALLSEIPYYGLRLGTVSGASPNLRIDIVVNAMYHRAKTAGLIELFNPDIHRPILAMSDLVKAIEAIIDRPGAPRGMYNLASFNTTPREVAHAVSATLGVPVTEQSASQTTPYNFSISTKKFGETFEFAFQGTIDSIISDLDAGYEHALKSKRDLHIHYEPTIHRA
ncbi:MAG: SDR family oxidoreductase [Patescibacteria group bacterium]